MKDLLGITRKYAIPLMEYFDGAADHGAAGRASSAAWRVTGARRHRVDGVGGRVL